MNFVYRNDSGENSENPATNNLSITANIVYRNDTCGRGSEYLETNEDFQIRTKSQRPFCCYVIAAEKNNFVLIHIINKL